MADPGAGYLYRPNLAYLLLLLGIYGIYFELTTPGFGVPGVVGSIALLLGMFALQMLPVTLTAIAWEKSSTIIFPMPIDLISSVLDRLSDRPKQGESG